MKNTKQRFDPTAKAMTVPELVSLIQKNRERRLLKEKRCYQREESTELAKQ